MQYHFCLNILYESIILQRGPEDHSQQCPLILQGVERLEQRLDADAQANIEQIKMIEELARQNEAMAESMKRSHLRLNYLTVLSVAALLAAVAGFIIISGQT